MNMGGIWTFAFFPHEASEMENDFSAWQIYEAELNLQILYTFLLL